MKNNQKGFSAVEGILVLIILGLVGFVGWYVYHTKNNTNDSYNKTASTSAAIPSQAETLTDASASKAVLAFYGKYIKITPPGNPPAEELFINQYGTTNLLNYFKDNQNGVDPIVCAQNIPDSFKITSSTLSQGVATVALDATFGTGKRSLTTTVVDKGGLKIDSIECANPLPTASPEGN